MYGFPYVCATCERVEIRKAVKAEYLRLGLCSVRVGLESAKKVELQKVQTRQAHQSALRDDDEAGLGCPG